jgi:putative transposase
MARKRLSKNQILQVLEKYKNGFSIKEIIEEYSISQATFYNWKAKYGDTGVRCSQELKTLKEDNERLKRMFADISLENIKLKALLQNLQSHH